VPGTGTHDANNITGYNANAVNRYLGEDKKPDVGKKADSETGVPDQKVAA